MRSLIVLLPLAAMVAACDTQAPSGEQANTATPAAQASATTGKVDRSHKGEAAPNYAFSDPEGVKKTIADYAGRPVLVNLWATWCAPCVKEMPTLEALAKRESGKLDVLTIAQDLDGPAKVVPYFQKAGFTAIEPWSESELQFTTGLGANLPTTILYDREGKEVWRVAGSMDWTGDEAKVLLAEAG
ncbi:TlpA family protein disulfide reductase [Sphingomonas sp. IW22]|uniref:TlpA family protein disulfide reductase n=1 Tax=Sphingomonas sp. IW22 TaxID=3242489 RepID=UPI003521A931